ncbi:MAG: hypothetical protein KAT93_01205 [Desulfuromonadales bacterium]|nr:hypothetical protein [Desulfuromonadales bacterium]
MIKKIVFLAIVAGIVYLNYTNPKQADHEALLLAELQSSGAIPVELQEKIFRDIDFSNFLVCSAMKTSEESKMISLGYLKNVKMVNTSWAEDVRKKYQVYFSY